MLKLSSRSNPASSTRFSSLLGLAALTAITLAASGCASVGSGSGSIFAGGFVPADNVVVNEQTAHQTFTKEHYRYNPKKYEALQNQSASQPIGDKEKMYVGAVLNRFDTLDRFSQNYLDLGDQDIVLNIYERDHGVLPLAYAVRKPRECALEAGVQLNAKNQPYLAQEANYKFSESSKALFYDYSFLQELVACESYRQAAIKGLNKIYDAPELQKTSPKYLAFFNNLVGVGIAQPTNSLFYGFYAYPIYLEQKKVVKTSLVLAQREFKAGRKAEFLAFVDQMTQEAMGRENQALPAFLLKDTSRQVITWAIMRNYFHSEAATTQVENLSREQMDYMSDEIAKSHLDKLQKSTQFQMWYKANFAQPGADTNLDFKPFAVRESDPFKLATKQASIDKKSAVNPNTKEAPKVAIRTAPEDALEDEDTWKAKDLFTQANFFIYTQPYLERITAQIKLKEGDTSDSTDTEDGENE